MSLLLYLIFFSLFTLEGDCLNIYANNAKRRVSIITPFERQIIFPEHFGGISSGDGNANEQKLCLVSKYVISQIQKEPLCLLLLIYFLFFLAVRVLVGVLLVLGYLPALQWRARP